MTGTGQPPAQARVMILPLTLPRGQVATPRSRDCPEARMLGDRP